MMKKALYTILLLVLVLLPLQTRAEGTAIKLEFSGTSMGLEGGHVHYHQMNSIELAAILLNLHGLEMFKWYG